MPARCRARSYSPGASRLPDRPRALPNPSAMSDRQPSFERPPLIETVLGVQFAPIRGLTTGHLGLFGTSLGDQWRQAGEGEPVGQILLADELPGSPFGEAIAVHGRARRLRFRDASDTRLVQVENGWLVYNWRRRGEQDEYPRFEKLLLEFHAVFAQWREFLAAQRLEEAKTNLWEVCYVNAVERGTVWQSPADWPEVFPALLAAPRLAHLGPPTTGALRWRFPLAANRGSLEITFDHVRDEEGRHEALRMTQVARGRISGQDDLDHGLQLGHEAIVRTFDAATSDAAHRHWGRAR